MEALNSIREFLPEVVLLDIELGAEDGIEVAEKVAALGIDAKVVLISLRDRSDLGEQIAQCGAIGFLRKDKLSAQSISSLVASCRNSTMDAVGDGGLASPPEASVVVTHDAILNAVFTAIAYETSRLIGVEAVSLIRYDAEMASFTRLIGTENETSVNRGGTEFSMDECPEGTLVLETGNPSRLEKTGGMLGTLPLRPGVEGSRDVVAAPITINGRLWGLVAAYGRANQSLPIDCEFQLAEYTSLMSLAIANAEARDEYHSLADQQAALRRVATIVAQGADPHAVFTAVSIEASRLLGVNAVSMMRYDSDTKMLTKLFGTHGERSPVRDGVTFPLADSPEAQLVVETGDPSRVEDWSKIPGPKAAQHRAEGFGQSMAAPVIIDGEIWGFIAAYTEANQTFPIGCEQRLAEFTNLMAMAISNAQTREDLRMLAEQQGAALRRVATLVGQQAPSRAIFDAVAGEASRALNVNRVDVCRCYEDGTVALIGSIGGSRDQLGASIDFPSITMDAAARVLETRSATVHFGSDTSCEGNEGGAVAAPINVDGELWGVIVALLDHPAPQGMEVRLADFTHLVANSISNVHARDKLIESRARIVNAGDETRRQIERNVHDGIQQRILAIAFELRTMCEGHSHSPAVLIGLEQVIQDLEVVLDEIRVFSHGLHPASLSRLGLGQAIRGIARRSPISVEIDLKHDRRLPDAIEIAIYYLVSEVIANAAKHSGATRISVEIDIGAPLAKVLISDNGIGGARVSAGTGLIGLIDRVEALGGRLTLQSPPGKGTTVVAYLPTKPTNLLSAMPTSEFK
jgi:signal transduction histidine kinase/CheY-like chemotaxis protein